MTLEEQIKKLIAERDAALKEANRRIEDEEYVRELREDRDKAQSKRDAALKACAQKDDALQDCSQFPLGESLHYKVCSALDDNICGKGYHHDDEWRPVVEALKKISNFPFHAEPVGALMDIVEISEQALAHAERLTGKETK